MTKYKLILCLLIIAATIEAQNLVFSGKITFEKKENLHKQFTEMNSWTEEYIKRIPKYRTDIFELDFNTKKAAYFLKTEDENQGLSWLKIAGNNQVWSSFSENKYTAIKEVYEKNYLLEDSLPAYDWKYLGEYREIAGYTCRKAATILFDSVYVIAFYTEQIPVMSGPEAFNGLPGMILGVVIPRLHLTWFATKVEPMVITDEQLPIPKTKAKKTTLTAFREELSKGLKDWGEYAQKVVWKANF